MQKEVRKFLNNKKNFNNEHWNEFTNFLMKTLSLNVVFGLTIALTVYGFFNLGSFLDNYYGFEPWLTVIFTFIGIGIGGLTGYVMIQKYFKKPVNKDIQTNAKNEFESQKKLNDKTDYPVVDVTIDQVRKAVRQFSDNLPKGVYRTIIVQDDNSIDFKQLANILGGVPSKKFYMSKETYDLFEENEKKIPSEMDMVQRAVDLYVKERKEYPMLRFDPQRRVNYYQLIQENYLKSAPEIQFYITEMDGLITHITPKKKKVENSSQ